jgi:hypothetical protein
VERSELAVALEWTTAGVELCLAGQAVPEAIGDAAAGEVRAGSDGAGGNQVGDDAELRLLLRLRYRIRNDLGLPEDDYDAMLDDA